MKLRCVICFLNELQHYLELDRTFLSMCTIQFFPSVVTYSKVMLQCFNTVS